MNRFQLAFCLLIGLTTLTTRYSFAQQPPSSAKVIVSPINFEHDGQRIQAVGSAEAFRSVIVFSAVSDRVTDVLFSPGDNVEANSVLVHLDDRRQQVAVERAKINLADAQRTLIRLQESRKQGAIPQSDLDNAMTAQQLAQVALDEAKVELEDRVIRAPFSGVVGLTDVEIGDRITLQTPITSIDSRTKLYVNFNAPESALPMLNQRPSLTLRPWLNESETVTAEIAQIDSRINLTDRTVRVRALLDNAQDRFRPGMSFKVELSLIGQQYPSIPEVALMWDATGAYVWVVDQQKAQRVDVDIKQRLPGRILVEGNLQPQQLLITEGIQRLRNGQSVSFPSAAQG